MNAKLKKNGNRTTDWLMSFVGLLPAIGGVLLYSHLPEQMATHFGVNGQPNQTMDRPWALLTLAILGVGIPFLTKLSRKIDPKKESFMQFERAYEIFRWAITLFLAFVGFYVLAFNLGYHLGIQWVTSLGLGLLFMIMGNYMGKIRYNYTFGVRTPWTLSSEAVWRRTHRAAGPVWVTAGAVMAASILLPDLWSIWCTLGAIACAALIPVVYSYLVFRSTKNVVR